MRAGLHVGGSRAALRDSLDGAVRCLVVTGVGKSFSAGADIAEWSEADEQDAIDGHPWMEECHGLIAELAEFPRPTVAWLNGVAVAAGLDLALAAFNGRRPGGVEIPTVKEENILTDAAGQFVAIEIRRLIQSVVRVLLTDDRVLDDSNVRLEGARLSQRRPAHHVEVFLANAL